MTRRVFLFLFELVSSAATTWAAYGESSVFFIPDIISSGMVLQQQTEVCLWGKAAPEAIVTVKTDWSEKLTETKVATDSTWQLRIATPAASFTPHRLVFSMDGKELETIDNVLIGEVWLCSGQSNMQMPLNGFWNCPIEGGNEEIALAGQWAGRIRMATIPTVGNIVPQEYAYKCQWQVPNMDTAPRMSAAAWFFAKMLTQALDVPIGIIACAWGGSRVEGWLPRNILETYPDVNLEEEIKASFDGKHWHYNAPMAMYNGMLYPLRHFTIKGFLWYQGEANVDRDATYAQHLRDMVVQWRKDFGDPTCSLPFYEAEIAPWAGYGGAEGESGALLREAQHAAAKLIENCRCIVTNDLVKPYEAHQIHPANKRDVGNRFAFMALHHTYGKHQVVGDSPEFDHVKVDGQEVEVFFRYAEEGLSPRYGIEGFELAGKDGKYHQAEARLNEKNKSVVVSCPEVAEPAAIRYCFKSFQIGNLINHRGLPLVPFRHAISQE